MPVKVDIEVEHLLEVQRQMEKTVADLHGAPVLNAFRTATLLVQRDAKINAPVDTGRLRASITPEVRAAGDSIEGVVGSNVFYAPFVELGTRAHWPPPGALEVWARRHGVPEFLVRRAIGLKGTKAVKFLQDAFEKNKDRIVREIERAIGAIVK